MRVSGSQEGVSIEEMLSTLKNTSLPTVVIEGSDDVIIFRRLEERFSNYGISIFPVGGRENVLKLFLRRRELPRSVAVVFIADKDVWSFTGIDAIYTDPCLIFTSGYSIENDVFVDGNLQKLLRPEEIGKFDVELKKFIQWYALALYRHLNDSQNCIKTHPNHVLKEDIYLEMIRLNDGENYPEEIKDRLEKDYQMLIRGKSLMNLLLRNISYKGRDVKHNDKIIFEMVSIAPGNLIEGIYAKVASFLISPSKY